MYIFLFVLNLFLVGLNIFLAVTATTPLFVVLYIITAILWGICAIFNLFSAMEF